MNGFAPLRQVALPAGTITDETPSIPLNVQGYRDIAVYLKGTGTINAGVVVVEEADYNPKTEPIPSAWATLYSFDADDTTGGATVSTHLPTAAYSFIRLRVTTAIGGGGSVEAAVVAS